MKADYELLSKNAQYSEKSLRTEWEKSDAKISEQQKRIDKLMSEIKLAKDQVKEADAQK
jgi:hypothetical protein